jgi:hypothetical protein
MCSAGMSGFFWRARAEEEIKNLIYCMATPSVLAEKERKKALRNDFNYAVSPFLKNGDWRGRVRVGVVEPMEL